tara:strand:+ start:223 stop:597 length:375 start_codon:yes stop_codon:yes gene_type:complete
MDERFCIGNANLNRVVDRYLSEVPDVPGKPTVDIVIGQLERRKVGGMGYGDLWVVDIREILPNGGKWDEDFPAYVAKFCSAVVLEEVCHAMGMQHNSSNGVELCIDNLRYLILINEYWNGDENV